MAIKRRLSGYSGMRIDWPHIRSIESSVSNDFDSMLRGLMTGLNRPYLVRGFRIKIPSGYDNPQSLQIEVADSVVLHSSATESGTVLSVPAGTADETLDSNNTKIIGSFQPGVINYISLDYRRSTDTSTIDQTAGWSPSQKLEFQRSVPIGKVLDYKFIISTSGFSTNLPLYSVKVDSNNAVEYITKASPNFFRLGSGGPNPNPANSFTFGNIVNTDQTGNRREWIDDSSSAGNPVTVVPGNPSSAFDLGDFSIKNMKDWMDAVMTRFKEVTGSSYWYVDGAMSSDSISLKNLWWDAIGSTLTGVGSMSYNLILEASAPEIGYWQSSATDSTILPGDSYVEGFTSRTKATISRFNQNQLAINSLTSAAFTYGETLWNRRVFRPSASYYRLVDYTKTPNKWAVLNKTAAVVGGSVLVATWSYQNISSNAGDGLFYSKILVTTSSPHGFNVGDFIKISGLNLSGSTQETKFWPGSSEFPLAAQVKERISDTEFTYYVPYTQDGTPVGSSGTVLLSSSSNAHPYMPKFSITEWSNTLNYVTILAENNNFVNPVAETGTTSSGSYNITNLSATSGLKLNMAVSGTGIPSDTVVTKIISSTSVEISNQATSSGSVALMFKDKIHVSGLTCTANAPNGVWEVDAVDSGEVSFYTTYSPTGTPAVSSDSYIRPDVNTIVALAVTGSTTEQFNVKDVKAYAVDETKIHYLIGTEGLPELSDVTGGLTLDGVVAEATVLDPVRVASIENTSANVIKITTSAAHGYSNSGTGIKFTIFGSSTLNNYIRTYADVILTVVDDLAFELSGSGVPFDGSESTYTNSSEDPVFVKFQDNPYPGPVAWDSDMYIKGIIGDRYFKIPSTAVAYSAAEDEQGSELANNFNISGQTGTVYLRDGEVAYIKIERDEYVSNGDIWTTAGAGATFTAASTPKDKDDQLLEAGDFIKFEDEDESKWIRISGVSGNSFTVVNDNGQSPDAVQRPAKSGKLLYCKGTYSKVFVRKHYLVEPSANIYWIAVRRDNGGISSKVYLKGLELEAGEVRQFDDNQTSNILDFIGAPNEGAVNPNYSVSDVTGDYQYTQSMQVDKIDTLTRMVTFAESATRGIQKGDRIRYSSGDVFYYYTVKQPISTRSAIVTEDLSTLPLSSSVTLFTENKNIADQDNLTKAIRKEDRELGAIQTAYDKPVYDESVFVQQINLNGSGDILAGSYIYTGSQSNPSALAWVLHGTISQIESIEGNNTLPGGHSTIGSDSILVHIIKDDSVAGFVDGASIYQNGSLVGTRQVDNSGNPDFLAPSVYGNSSDGVEIVLPPNKRTQVRGSEYVVWGAHSTYKASEDETTTGEDLLVIINDTIRQAGLDYIETFGGPKAKIKIARTLPPNSRIRFRTLSTFGSVLASKSSDISLQLAYNGGSTISEATGIPVEISAYDIINGETALITRGSVLINGGATAAGGIFNESTDKSFVIGNESDKPKEVWTGTDAVKTHDSHTGSAVIRKTAAHVTTDGIGTSITGSEITIPDLTAFRIRISAVARRSDASFGAASFSMEGTFYRDESAATGPQAAGSPISTINGADGSGVNYAIAFGISGNNIVAVVYGDTGNTVQWALTIEYQGVATSS